MYSGLFNSSNQSNQYKETRAFNAGLSFRCYYNYMNDNVEFFTNNNSPFNGGSTSNMQDISSATSGIINAGTQLDNFSIQWLGFFKPPTTGDWIFQTTSDDCSYLWIGYNATSGFTATNANVNNGGLHGSVTKTSAAIPLTANQYYPLRIQYGDATSNQAISVEFKLGNGPFTANGSGYYFYI